MPCLGPHGSLGSSAALVLDGHILAGKTRPIRGPQTIDERFDAPDLDPAVWTAAYLRAWSSLAEAAATYTLDGEGLHLRIPPEHPLWCPALHDPPLKVSAVQSGNWSGPRGSTQGQQPFRDGLVGREEQPARWGFTPHFGHIAVECRADLSTRSMFSASMVVLEDQPERCGEICIIEVFGDSVSRDDAGPADRRLAPRHRADNQERLRAGHHRVRERSVG